jgi:hypothetical protein
VTPAGRCPQCLDQVQPDPRADLYARGYEAGWRDALVRVRRLARMNPFLTPSRSETLLTMLLRSESTIRYRRRAS